jgi:DNA-binding PucR family transcriptional regulator
VHLARAVTRYDDVALEAALLCDIRSARRFVDRELGPLTSSDARIAVLRDTLASYLQSGLNAAAAAIGLHVSDRTIAYRIRSIEELLGRSVADRSSELAAAVRVHRVLNA